MSSVAYYEVIHRPKGYGECECRKPGRRKNSHNCCGEPAVWTIKTHGFFEMLGNRTGEPYTRWRHLCDNHARKFIKRMCGDELGNESGKFYPKENQ